MNRRHIDTRHIDTRVEATSAGWQLACPCGGHARRCDTTWRQTVMGALPHSAEIAA